MSEALGPCPKSHLIEELTAGVSDREDLQQVGGTQHALDVVLGDGDPQSNNMVSSCSPFFSF